MPLSAQVLQQLLSPGIREALERHGFFGPPRPPKPDAPTVQIQVTNACNLACAYCCNNSGRPRARETSFDRLLAVVKHIPDVLGPRTQVALLGGEPLLVPWSIDLASEIINLGLGLTLFTNGVQQAEDGVAPGIARLVKAGAEVRVSLSGPSAESCDSAAGAAVPCCVARPSPAGGIGRAGESRFDVHAAEQRGRHARLACVTPASARPHAPCAGRAVSERARGRPAPVPQPHGPGDGAGPRGIRGGGVHRRAGPQPGGTPAWQRGSSNSGGLRQRRGSSRARHSVCAVTGR